MTFEMQDLAAVATFAQQRGIRTLCDNSYASPLNQSPIALGIDMVVHSATKYLNGHSDVVAGALCASEEIIREVFRGPYMTCGAILSPHDAWLMIRGLRTLQVRMQRIGETTQQVLAFLQQACERSRKFTTRCWNPTRSLNWQDADAWCERFAHDCVGCRRRRSGTILQRTETIPDDGILGRVRVADVSGLRGVS